MGSNPCCGPPLSFVAFDRPHVQISHSERLKALTPILEWGRDAVRTLIDGAQWVLRVKAAS